MSLTTQRILCDISLPKCSFQDGTGVLPESFHSHSARKENTQEIVQFVSISSKFKSITTDIPISLKRISITKNTQIIYTNLYSIHTLNAAHGVNQMDRESHVCKLMCQIKSIDIRIESQKLSKQNQLMNKENQKPFIDIIQLLTGNKELVQSLIFDAMVTQGFDGNQGKRGQGQMP